MKTLKLGDTVTIYNKLTSRDENATVIDYNKHTVSVITQNDEMIDVSMKDVVILDEVA
jgi:hypothetical protein